MIYTVLAGRDCEHHLSKDLCFPSGKIVASHSEKGSERSASHVTETISTVSKCFSHITIMVFATSLPISKSSFLTLLQLNEDPSPAPGSQQRQFVIILLSFWVSLYVAAGGLTGILF